MRHLLKKEKKMTDITNKSIKTNVELKKKSAWNKCYYARMNGNTGF